MRPDLLAHLYDLALRALAEQERQVAALHGRLTPVLAAGGVGVTLLTRPAFHAARAAGTFATVASGLGVLAIGIAVLAATYVLLGDRLAFGIDASSARNIARDAAVDDLGGFYAAVFVVLDERWLENGRAIERMLTAFTVMVCGMLVGVCGLALAAAVAS